MSIFQQSYVRHQNRTSPDFPNKCDICGLRVKYGTADKETETALLTAAKLAEAGLAIYPPRNINVSVGSSHDTYFCVLANVKYWNQKTRKCPDWQLKLPEPGLTLSDYLSIHHSRNNTRIAIRLGFLAAILTLIGIVISYCSAPNNSLHQTGGADAPLAGEVTR